MNDEQMRMHVRLAIIKKYKRFKTFSDVHNFSPTQVNFWLSGRVKMPKYLLDLFGLERVVTVEYKEKSCTAATELNESQ